MSRRTCWSVDDVLSVEEHAVLLGFSNSGRYLSNVTTVYYKSCDQGLLQVYWRIFNPSSTPLVSPGTALAISVGPCAASSLQTCAYDDDMELRVWESIDESLVVAISNSGRRPGTAFHVTVSCGPSAPRSSVFGALRLTLSTTMSIPECWFFVSSTSQLVFHVGSSLLLFSLNCGNRHAPMLPHSTKPWYYASEFPVEVVAVPTDGTQPVTTTSDHPTKLLQ
ncbi:hypothetical protein AaE_009904, partial [Aphanomyces astaci]